MKDDEPLAGIALKVLAPAVVGLIAGVLSVLLTRSFF
jgi:hypothetical protein